jgi:hypothetical protein
MPNNWPKRAISSSPITRDNESGVISMTKAGALSVGIDETTGSAIVRRIPN